MILYATAKELIDFAVPGLPGTERNIKRRAEKDAWPSRPRKGRGGGVEYPILGTPDAQKVLTLEQQAHVQALLAERDAYAARRSELDQAAARAIVEAKKAELEREQEVQEEGLKASESLPERSKDRMNARLQVIGAWHGFWKGIVPPVSQTDSEPIFVFAYNKGEVTVDEWVRALVPSLSVASLRRWRVTLKREGLGALGGKYGNRKGTGLIDTQSEVRDFVIGMMANTPHARGAHILEGLKARYGKREDIKLPALRSLERWMNEWKAENAQTFLAVTNPDAWKNKNMVAFGSASESIERLNQRWEMDSTPADVMLADGKRYTLIGLVDVYSRRLKLLLSPSSKATAVSTLIRHGLLDWGVPELLKTDNGSDYKSKHIEMVVHGLGITQEFCPPFSPWHKPHVERAFRTFSHSFLELLPGYLGHSVAERKALEAQKSFADRLMKKDAVIELALTPEEFETFCEKWCDDYYHHEPHEGLSGKTPWQVASGWPHPVRRIEDPRVLDVLLAEAPNGNGLRMVHKSGIRIDGAFFIAPELEAHVGRQVQVRFDPLDLGRIYVFGAAEQGFVCVAECPERTGVSRQEIAAKAREMQKKRIQDERRALKAKAKKVNTDDVVREILEDRAEAAGKLARFPVPSTTHDSAWIQAAAEAIEARDRVPEAHREEDLAPGRALILQFEEEARAQASVEEPLDRYKRLLKKTEDGITLTDEERRQMAAFEKTPAYRGWLDFQELIKESQ